MSASPQVRISWTKQNYEKIILVGVLLALLVSAAVLVVQITVGRKQLAISGRETDPSMQRRVKPVNTRATEQSLSRLDRPYQAAAWSNRMFVSELRVACLECGRPIPYSAARCTYPDCRADQPEPPPPEKIDSDADLMPDMYEAAQRFNPQDPTDALADADGDGFTNLEEFQQETDPRDAEDYPPPIAKLRLVDVKAQPFKLRFFAVQELPGGQKRYQLNLRSLERTYFAKIGEQIEGYEVREFDAAAKTLVLVQGDRVMRLAQGKVINDQERLVQFLFLIDRSTVNTRLGQGFDLRGKSYRVVEAQPDSARVRDQETGKEHLIPKITPLEEAGARMGDDMMFGPEGPGGMMMPPDMMAPFQPPNP